MVRDADIEREAEQVEDPGEPAIPLPVTEEPVSSPPPEEPTEEEGEGDLPEGTVILYDESGQAYIGIPIENEGEEGAEGGEGEGGEGEVEDK